MRRGLLAVALATALAGCGATPAATRPGARLIAATDVHVAAALDLRAIEPAERYPDGARVVLLDAAQPTAAATTEPIVLSEGLLAAGGADADHEATRVVFIGRKAAADRYGIWACDASGADLRRAVDHPADCGGVALLPDGRVVYSAVVHGPGVEPGARSWALHVAPGDGTRGEQITFGGGCDTDPFVLRDGRIAYSTYLPGDPGRFAVFTVHPDGTGAAPFLGERGPERGRVRLTQAADGQLLLNAKSGVTAAMWADPSVSAGPLADDVAQADWVASTPGDALLCVDAGGVSWGTATLALAAADGRRFVHAVAVAPRRRPQGHLSMVKPQKHDGQLVAMDARLPGTQGAYAARLLRLPAGVGQSRDKALALGDIPLAADGSFFARVPANTALLLDLIDADGQTLVSGRTPFWVRPNEARVCVGCHETRDTAPPNRRPLAVLAEPVNLAGEERPEGVR